MFFWIVFLVILWIEIRHQLRKYWEEEITEELTEIEGYPDYPNCLEKKDLENVIQEEEMCRLDFGYKKMSDATYENFLNIREKMDPNNASFHEIPVRKIMNAPSYDIIQMSEYNW